MKRTIIISAVLTFAVDALAVTERERAYERYLQIDDKKLEGKTLTAAESAYHKQWSERVLDAFADNKELEAHIVAAASNSVVKAALSPDRVKSIKPIMQVGGPALYSYKLEIAWQGREGWSETSSRRSMVMDSYHLTTALSAAPELKDVAAFEIQNIITVVDLMKNKSDAVGVWFLIYRSTLEQMAGKQYSFENIKAILANEDNGLIKYHPAMLKK